MKSVGIIGKTTCALCSAAITEEADKIAFPEFLPEGHHLRQYSNAVFHRKCFNEWQRRDEFLEIFERWKRIYRERPMPPNDIKNFSDWYQKSEEVNEWKKKLNQFNAEATKSKK